MVLSGKSLTLSSAIAQKILAVTLVLAFLLLFFVIADTENDVSEEPPLPITR